MAAEEIVAGVYALGLGYVNAFFVASDDGLTLVDSGLPRREDRILEGAAALGPIRNIVLTHHHADHVGSLAALSAKTGAATYIHPIDARVTRGDVPRPGPQTLLGKVLFPLFNLMRASRPEPFDVANEVTDGQELPIAGGIKVVHTPGHTAGHVSYLRERVLFAGDAAANIRKLGAPIGFFTEDLPEARRSIRKLAELDFDVACFGHGKVLTGNANAAFRQLVDRLAK
jgi:glyoxylase-like metal-dependent hydrolase (beta-lactamase superfamily II)